MFLSFPRDFLWGAATAAHQVEGQNFNSDWWEWEQVAGRIKQGHSSRTANDWYAGRYEEDLDRAREIGLTALRISVEWSRIEPTPGEFDPMAFEFYRALLRAVRARGLTPFVTLHHFSNPMWLARQGGWENPQVIRRFSQFARRVVTELADLCETWITINEPNVFAYIGHVQGLWPPGKSDFGAYIRVLVNMARAHAGAYYGIKDIQPEARVGVAHHFRPFLPADPDSPLDRAVAALRDWGFNWAFFKAIEEGHWGALYAQIGTMPEVKGSQDFIGLNYYYVDRVMFDPANPAEVFGKSVLDERARRLLPMFSSVGNVEPESFKQTLTRLAKYGKPIYVTENGIFSDGNELQSEYLVTHLGAARRAMSEGADLRGYFWWTLVDNFEWAEGYEARFGLHHMDLESHTRTARPSAEVYARIIREGGLSDELQERYGRAD